MLVSEKMQQIMVRDMRRYSLTKRTPLLELTLEAGVVSDVSLLVDRSCRYSIFRARWDPSEGCDLDFALP